MNRLVLVGIAFSSFAFAASSELDCKGKYQVVIRGTGTTQTALVLQAGKHLARYSVRGTRSSDQIEYLDTKTAGGDFTLRVAVGPGPLPKSIPGFFLAATKDKNKPLVGSELVCRTR